MSLMQIQHGDYIRVAIPPFKHEQVPTRLAVQCAQAGFSPQQTLRRFQQRGDDTDSLYSMISAAQHAGDDMTFFQLQCLRHESAASADLQLPAWNHEHPQAFPLQPIGPDVHPSWTTLMHTAFIEEACVECEEEGPVAYVETWFLSGHFAYVTEYAKPYRVTQEVRWWREELIELWSDKIDPRKPVQFYWVQPTPITTFLRERLGHLLICQDVMDHLSPALLTIEFHSEETYHFGQAAALLPNPVTLFDVKNLARLNRHCLTRRCTLRQGRHFWHDHESRRVPAGAGLTFGIAPPSRGLHIGDEHVATSSLGAFLDDFQNDNEDIIPAQPPLRDQSLFTRNLFELWDRQATFGPAHLERLLRVETWYLDGRHIKHHDEQRNVVLADDYWTWEGALAHRWRDFVLPDIELDFAIATPTPSSAPSTSELHMILHQRIPDFERPSIVTVRDNAVLRGTPYTAAVILPSAVTKNEIIINMGKIFSCPPVRPDAACTCWHGSIEVEAMRPFPNRDGHTFDLHVYRPLHEGFWSDEEEEEVGATAQATSSTSLLQLSAVLQVEEGSESQPWIPAAEPTNEETPPSQRIDMAPAIACFEWLDSHLFLPCFDLQHLPAEHVAYDWVQEWWDPSMPCSHLCLYTDGSFSKVTEENESAGGAAVAAFVYQRDKWRFAGALSSALSATDNAYQTELMAITAAVKLAYDIIKLHVAQFGLPLHMSIRHDATTVGRQADGSWHCISCPSLGKALRSLVLMVEAAFGVTANFEHVKGHSGDPGNELVDFLASAARAGQPLTPFEDWVRSVAQPCFVEKLQWAWLLFDATFAPFWHNNEILFPSPQTQPSAHLLSMPRTTAGEAVPSPEYEATITMKIATCNVLTLKGKNDQLFGLSGVSRQRMMIRQMNEEGIVIFGLQETRLQKLHAANDPDYLIYKSAASQQGHFGIIAGFAKQRPYGEVVDALSGKKRKLYFKDNHITVISFAPRFLVLRVAAPYLRAIVVVAHAPHSGHDISEIDQWWNSLTDEVPALYQDWPLLLLCDANSHVGSTTSSYIGSFQAGKADEKTAPFEDYVARSALWLPSTFEQFQKGDGSTWSHTTGRQKRLDYVGLPTCWAYTNCEAWVSQQIDPAIVREDHHAACVAVSFTSAGRDRWQKQSDAQLRHLDVRGIQWEGLNAHSDLWVDVHSHLNYLQQQLIEHLAPQNRAARSKPKKTTISESTWQMVCEKREWRTTLHQYQTLQKRSILGQVFSSWKRGKCEAPLEYDKLHRMQDGLIAGALWHFRHLGRQVSSALRRDDCIFFETLLAEGAEFLQPSQVKQLWRVVRRALPKFQQRKLGYHPFKLVSLEDQWASHFEALECGTPITSANLVAHCDKVQVLSSRDRPPLIELKQLPSLCELEDAFRQTQADRSTGFDRVPSAVYHQHAPVLARYFYQVLLKAFVWGCEPVQSKGGELKVIPKKPGANQVQQFRGILLLPTFAKRTHAILRSRLMTQTSRRRDPAQMGGYAGQQVAFGSHLIRALSNVFAAQGWSSAVIFVDLATAFHHLVRQLVCGAGEDEEVLVVLASLRQSHSPQEADELGCNLIGILERLDIDPLLLRLLRDVHLGTWYSLTGDALTQTHRGTRPGSPLADAIFHILMGDIARNLRIWINQQTEYVDLLAKLDLDPMMVIWSDDLAIPWATATAEALPPAIAKLAVEIDRQFRSRGFTINYAIKGKTSVVISLLGSGAPELRRQLLLGPHPGMEIYLTEGRQQWLHFVTSYKHLGSLFSSSHAFEPELRQRLGMARAAFSQTSRAVLRNRHFPLRLRVQFLQSLIFSKLFFGLGAWTTPSLQQMRRLSVEYCKMLKAVLRCRPDEQISHQQLFVRTDSVDVRVRLAIDRLGYARRLFQLGPAELQQVLHLEKKYCSASWLDGLVADLQWMKGVLPQDLPFFDGPDITQTIEYWQQDGIPWKSLLKKATRRHKLQEEIMSEVHDAHDYVLKTLRQAGASFSPDVEQVFGVTREAVHACECGRSFSTSQGLALHRRKIHGIHAPEHAFIAGATCPACMQFFWSSNRLAMHLSYMPRGGGANPCFAFLSRVGYQVAHETQDLPSALKGAVRMDALQLPGPLPQFVPYQVELLSKIDTELKVQIEELTPAQVPEDPVEAGMQLGETLAEGTQRWVDAFCAREFGKLPDLIDWWFGCLATFGHELEDWAAETFVAWGEHWLPEISARAIDGEVEFALDDAFCEIVDLLPCTSIKRRISFLRQQQRRLQDEMATPPQPHRPVRRGTASAKERSATRHTISSLFAEQSIWQHQFRRIAWCDLPVERGIPLLSAEGARPCLLVVHLFSGRRRAGDFHWHLHKMAEDLDVTFIVLSMDTAVSPFWGDLHRSSSSWRTLARCYQAGLVAGTLTGSPCETFSEARFTEPPEGLGWRWPRPLRSASLLYGLPGLTMRELGQVQLGSNFFLQGLEVLGHHLAEGGLFLSEHPGVPLCPERPSTWRAALTELLRGHPEVHLSHIRQFEFGADAVKPTGLMACRMPRLLRILRAHADPAAVKPTEGAIGLGSDGAFKTAKLKEYPPRLCEGLARSFCDHFRTAIKTGHVRYLPEWGSTYGDLKEWVEGAAQISSHIRTNAVWMPDHQPRHR